MARESSSSIMSVGEMIDTAFGEPDVNVVHHKLIQTILYILARQLRVLERRVEIEIGPGIQPSSSSLSITEVKVHAMQKKAKRQASRATSKNEAAKGSRSMGGLGGSKNEAAKGLRSMGGLGSSKNEAAKGLRSMGGLAGSKNEAAKGLRSMGGLEGRGGKGPLKSDGQPTSGSSYSADKTSSDKSKSTDKTSSDITSSDKITSDKTSSDKTSSAKTTTDKTSSDKTTSGKTTSDITSSDKTSSGKTTTDKTSSDITSSGKTTTDKTSSDKTSSGKTTTDKTSSDKTSSDKETADKTSSDKISSDKTTTDKSSSDKTSSGKTTSDKTSSDKTSSGKTTSDKTSSDKTSSDKETADKTSSDKISSDKTTTDKSSSDKTTSDKTSSGITSSDKTTTEKISSDKTSSEPISTDKTSTKDTSSTDKPSTMTSSKSTTEKSTSNKTSTEKSSSAKTTTDTSSSNKRGPGDYVKLLEAVEEQRESELRVIHQRADSREVSDKTPSPMASMESVEATYEKLLVVERIPAEEARAISARERSGKRDIKPGLSIVTQDQFGNLAAIVRQLQQKFAPAIGNSTFPENIELMQELRKGASLTDAMAALQLSARLEATEKALQQMLSIVTDLASKTPGIDLTSETPGTDMKVIFGTTEDNKTVSEAAQRLSRKSTINSAKTKKEPTPIPSPSVESVQITLPRSVTQLEAGAPSMKTDDAQEGEKENPDRITYEELDDAMQELKDEIFKTVKNLTSKTTVNADNALKIASRIEGKLETSMNVGTKMRDLETLVSNYADQINILDTGLSSQMTNFQEELTQMQHDLETALETMAEVFANAGGDTTAVAELNAQFSNLQSDIDTTMMRQNELRNTQNALSFDLESLRKQIEILREVKADRDEVADALRDKAGLGALNGLVSLQQFGAVRGDFEKQIGCAYDKFNSQEMIWQKAIDELLRELNEKADWIQVVSLKEDINKHLENIRCRLNMMMEVVGEPRAAAVAKKLHRDATCLSCATPADMNLEEPGIIPALPSVRPPTIGAEALQPREDGDHGICYPGRPILHPRDPRSHVCQRWCGGSHTIVTNTVSRNPVSMIITPAQRQVTTALGTDGKAYMVDETMKPCAQCYMSKTTPQPSEVMDQEHVDNDFDMPDFQEHPGTTLPSSVDITPPPPQDDY